MVYKNKLLKKWFYSSCLLCIFGALSYVYHQPNYNFYGIFHDKNIAIEQAIEHIPICTANDRSRHRALIHTLQVWTKFAQQHHIRYWIAYGTLVSYVQRRGLLPYDPDINLFIMAQDTSQLLQLSQLNILSTYELKVHPQWYIVDDTKRWYFSSEGIDFVAPNARFINSNDNLHLDIWPIYDYHPNHTRIEKNSRAMLTAYDKSYKWRSTPKEWTFPLQECKFSGVEVWCPAEPEKLVTDIYGEISFNMSSEKCVNGTWVKSNEFNSPKKVLEINNQTIHTKHKTNRYTASTSLKDFFLIENALKQIPTCTLADRPRQRVLLNLLQTWSYLAEKYNLEYWISYGTLIGYVQRRGLLPHDADLDITIMSNDTPKLIQMSQSNFSSKYKIQIQPQWHFVGYANRSYFYGQDIHFIAPNGRFFNTETNFHVDIYPAHNFNPLYSSNSREDKHSENLTVYGRWYEWLSYPRTWTYPLKTCYFSDIKMLCPAEPEKLVEIVYGTKALTESDTKCVNGRWV